MNYWYQTKAEINETLDGYRESDKFVVFLWAKDELEEGSGVKLTGNKWAKFTRSIEKNQNIYEADCIIENELLELARKTNK